MSDQIGIDDVLTLLGAGYETADQVLDAMAGAGASDGLESEKRICLAMIELAVEDLTANRKRRNGYAGSAMAWIKADYSSSLYPDIRTFEGCCMSVGLNPEKVRAAILRLTYREGRARRMDHAVIGGRKRKARIYVREQAAA